MKKFLILITVLIFIGPIYMYSQPDSVHYGRVIGSSTLNSEILGGLSCEMINNYNYD